MNVSSLGPIFIGMNYLIYKITNKLNNKIYVGKHKTDFLMDGYFGSGLLLKRAMEKHGSDQFTKEILFECKSEEEMNQKEADIVDEEFIARDDTYNIKLGGNGGFDHINKTGNNGNHSTKHLLKIGKIGGLSFKNRLLNDDDFRIEFIEKAKNRMILRQISGNLFRNKKHTEETKNQISSKMKILQKGKLNSQYGKHWITNGIESRLVPKENPLPKGFEKGRV